MAKIYSVIPTLTKKEQERFWKKVDKAPGQGPHGDCWVWIGGVKGPGYKHGMGYGEFHVNGKIAGAHRIAYFLANGQIDCTLTVCHACDNRLCCNPDHLWQGTQQENLIDMVRKGRNVSKVHPELVPRGDRHSGTKIPDSEVPKIRNEYAQKLISRQELANRYGVRKNTIDKIIQRRTRKHIP